MKSPMGSRTVLIIEDNPINMKLIRDLLRRGGYAVLEATDARAGMELALEHKPALILMDIQLPGMDGLTATQCIKEDPVLGDIPVVAMTAHAMRGDDRKAREAGCDGYISKPIDTRSFLSWLSEFIQGSVRGERPRGRKKIDYKIRILTVDDNSLNAKLLESKLPPDRYEVLVATSGMEAMEKLAGNPPELILLNDVMPGIDGYEVSRRMKADPETGNIPIIMVTTLGKGDEEKAGEAGIEEFINKPVNTTELQSRIRSVLRVKQYRDQVAIRRQAEEFFSLPSIQGEPVQAESPPSVLLVENNEKDTKLIQCHLQGQPCRLLIAENGEEALSIVARENIDLVLLDIIMSCIDGFEFCRRLKEMARSRYTPVVAITSLQDLENRIKGIERGIDDYLVKPINSKELRARIKILLKKKRYIDALQSAHRAAFNFPIMDQTTELYNHIYFKRFLEFEVEGSLRFRYPLALVLVDIDDLKRSIGHSAGDVMMRELAGMIGGNIREIDLVARYSDDVFAVVLPYCDKGDVDAVLQRIRKGFASHPLPLVAPSPGSITLKTGIAFCPSDALNAGDLVQNAESMLYRAKNRGKTEWGSG